MKTFLSRAALAGLMLSASMLASAADIPRTQAPQDAQVFIVTPVNGDTVAKTFKVKFGVSDISLAPAGDQTPHTGHLGQGRR